MNFSDYRNLHERLKVTLGSEEREKIKIKLAKIYVELTEDEKRLADELDELPIDCT
jgi:hypothetical protein